MGRWAQHTTVRKRVSAPCPTGRPSPPSFPLWLRVVVLGSCCRWWLYCSGEGLSPLGLSQHVLPSTLSSRHPAASLGGRVRCARQRDSPVSHLTMAPHRPPVIAFSPALTVASSFRRILAPPRGGGGRALPASQSRRRWCPDSTPPAASTGPPTPAVAANAVVPLARTPTPGASPTTSPPTPTPTPLPTHHPILSPATHTVTYRGRRIPVAHGTTLRTALIRAGATPHNGRSTVICCRGLGTCGTCSVAVVGGDYGDGGGGAVAAAATAATPVDGAATGLPPPSPPLPVHPPAISPGLSPPTPSARERARLAFPPHTAAASAAGGLRLACQVRVVGDVEVAKGEGFWGHRPSRLPPLPTEAEEGA